MRRCQRQSRAGVFGLVAALALVTPSVALADEGEAAAASAVPLHFVDNFTQTFAVPPDFLWAELKRMYIEGNKYRDLGFAMEMIAPSPHSPFGGTIATRMEGAELDRREANFIRIDDKERFLALRAAYNNGIVALVSYDVRPSGESGSLMQLIVHARQPLSAAGQVDGQAARAEAEALAAFHYTELERMWAAEAVRIEKLYREQAN